MSVGDARHGRRDNGLVAAEYVVAGDVDPRVGEHLLDVLALDGIAAYLRPSTDLHPVTRSTILPSRPTDRLFVDRAHVNTARDYLSQLAQDAEVDGAAETEIDAESGNDPDEATGRSADEATERGTDDAAGRAADGNGTDGTDGTAPPPALPPRGRRMSEPSNDDVDRVWAEIIAGYDATATAAPKAYPTDPPRPDTTKPETTRPDSSRPEAARPDATRPETRPDRSRPDRTKPDRERPEPDRPDRDRSDRDRTERDRPEQTPPYRIGPRMTSGPVDEPSLLDGLDTFGADLPDEGDDSFTPPEAPPVPRPSLPTALAVIGMIGGLAVFLKPDLLSFINASMAMFLGFTAIVSGFGTLVWRLRPGDDDDDDPDDGARV